MADIAAVPASPYENYLFAHVIRERYRISYARLLTLVASKAVDVFLAPGSMPRYRVTDIEADLANRQKTTTRTRLARPKRRPKRVVAVGIGA